ncbi:MAG: PAS domain-containing protein [Rhodospirillaceae bacterium]|nr:PAS domain-containing protein [Rhodospirillaceae bacterium]
MARDVQPTGKERFFNEDQIIVSKTDTTGHLTYVNPVFLDLYGGSEDECLGNPHSMVRHPDMPRCVFKLLWDTLGAGKEIFAYVKNMSKNGDHYWVLAHATPSRDTNGQVIGFHSNRRVPNRKVVDEVIIPLYKQLLDIENGHANRKDGMNEAFDTLLNILKEKGMAYDEFIFSLQEK